MKPCAWLAISLSVLLAACNGGGSGNPSDGGGGSDPSDGGSAPDCGNGQGGQGGQGGSTNETPQGFGNPCIKDGKSGLWSSDGECCVDGCLDGTYALCQHKTCTDSLDCEDATQCGFGGWCQNCDDQNPCTDDVCTVSGCAHFPWAAQKSCTTYDNEPGNCTIDDFGPNPAAVCCPTGTCLDVVNGNTVCVASCSGGKSCGFYSGACE